MFAQRTSHFQSAAYLLLSVSLRLGLIATLSFPSYPSLPFQSPILKVMVMQVLTDLALHVPDLEEVLEP